MPDENMPKEKLKILRYCSISITEQLPKFKNETIKKIPELNLKEKKIKSMNGLNKCETNLT